MLVVPLTQVTATSASQSIPLPTSVTVGGVVVTRVSELHIRPAAGNYSFVSVYDTASNIVLEDLYGWEVGGNSASGGPVNGFDVVDYNGNSIELSHFGVLFAHSGDKWNAYVVIR